MGPSQQTAVTAATQEVRFATVWTGGVSLAIWMGGVARELNLLDQAGRRARGRRHGSRGATLASGPADP